jgi:hypothetical protein
MAHRGASAPSNQRSGSTANLHCRRPDWVSCFLDMKTKALHLQRTPSTRRNHRRSDDSSCARYFTVLDSDLIKLLAYAASSMIFYHDESVHARNRQRNVQPKKQIAIGCFLQSLVEAESSRSNDARFIKHSPVHRMIIMGVRNRGRFCLLSSTPSADQTSYLRRWDAAISVAPANRRISIVPVDVFVLTRLINEQPPVVPDR